MSFFSDLFVDYFEVLQENGSVKGFSFNDEKYACTVYAFTGCQSALGSFSEHISD